ncbi:MAG: phospholipase A [Rhodoferax sp.]|nr:phospholipase A [Rhodoferax sp.]
MVHAISPTGRFVATCVLVLAGLSGVSAQTLSAPPSADLTAASWQRCARLEQDKEARLACFDRWAAEQVGARAAPVPPAPILAAAPARAPGSPVARPQPVTLVMAAPSAHDCSNPRFSELSRFWELETGSDCGTFSIRGYRPISLSLIASDSINTQPSSPAADHTAALALPYSRNETSIQLSVRTKIAQGLLTRDSLARDSLWFGYSQLSHWQFFNSGLSRPFRTTDHEPELTYVYPAQADLPLGWRLRFVGVTAVHQSNGQSLPLSRSWNRTVLMAGVEHGARLRVTGRVWKRMPESAANDDNPDVSDFVGRGELAGSWDLNRHNTLGVTLRHSMKSAGKGSVRLEWFKSLDDESQSLVKNGLRLHVQLFSGYGDTLVDYNRHRTKLSMGLSLVDW